jgi:hypothetical protein
MNETTFWILNFQVQKPTEVVVSGTLKAVKESAVQ